MRHILELDFHNADPDNDIVSYEFKRIGKMIEDGYRSGEILADDGSGSTIRGWWDYRPVDGDEL